MIVLDTNVLSALMQSQPDSKVVSWLDGQPAESVWITSITWFEARFGIALLEEGRRRKELETQFARLVNEDLDDRVLVFDESAASQAAVLAAHRRREGRPVDVRDTLIAGIVIARRATLATGNGRHFDDLPVPVINPWSL